MSYSVSRRVREIGVHMAVGAAPSRIVRMFIADGLKIYLVGLLLGLALTIGVTPFLEPFLYRTSVLDPTVYLLSALVLTLVVLGANYLPASVAGALNAIEACVQSDSGASFVAGPSATIKLLPPQEAIRRD